MYASIQYCAKQSSMYITILSVNSELSQVNNNYCIDKKRDSIGLECQDKRSIFVH